MLEYEVDDDGDVEALVVGGHDDAVRALATRRRLHGRPTELSGGFPSFRQGRSFLNTQLFEGLNLPYKPVR